MIVLPGQFFKSTGQRVQRRIWHLTIVAMLATAFWFLSRLDWHLIWEASPFLLRGLRTSFALTSVSMLGGFLLGALLAGMRLSRFRTVRYLSLSFVEIVRATPQLMIIFWIYLSYPALTGHAMNAWMAAAVALSLIAGAYLAEVIRGGLFSIPIEQKETAALLGLQSMQVFVFVLMPQACRNMLPALIATTIMMFKTTSLVFVIGLVDFFRAAMIVNNREFAPLTCFTVVALGYFLCCYALSSLLRFFDPRYTITS